MLKLPTITDPKKISAETMQAIQQYGFCHVVLPEHIISAYEQLLTLSQAFFKQPEDEKTSYKFNEKFEGYLIHRVKGAGDVMRYVYIGNRDNLAPIYAKHHALLEQLRVFCRDEIAKPLMRNILQSVNLVEHMPSLIENNRATLSQVYYPAIPSSPNPDKIMLAAHEDITFLTMLYTTKPGLQVLLESSGWQDVPVKKDHVIVNIGLVLSMVTGGAFHSNSHRVVLQKPNAERISIASFFSQAELSPVVDLTTNETLYPSFKSLFEERINRIYDNRFGE